MAAFKVQSPFKGRIRPPSRKAFQIQVDLVNYVWLKLRAICSDVANDAAVCTTENDSV